MKDPWKKIPENQQDLEQVGDFVLAFRCAKTKKLYFRSCFPGGWVMRRPLGNKKCEKWDLLGYARKKDLLGIDTWQKLTKSFE